MRNRLAKRQALSLPQDAGVRQQSTKKICDEVEVGGLLVKTDALTVAFAAFVVIQFGIELVALNGAMYFAAGRHAVRVDVPLWIP